MYFLLYIEIQPRKLTSFLSLYFNIEHIPFSSVSVADFEQVNINGKRDRQRVQLTISGQNNKFKKHNMRLIQFALGEPISAVQIKKLSRRTRSLKLLPEH